MAGDCRPCDPFYLGLYGGSEQSGLLDSDFRAQGFYTERGYQPAGQTVVLRRDLAGFRPIVDRNQMQARRRTTLQVFDDPAASTWWQACTFGCFERMRFELHVRGTVVAGVNFWEMEPFSNSWGARAVGLTDLEVCNPERRQGLAKYLLGEAMRQLHAQGFALIEAQVPADNVQAIATFHKLGFTEVDRAACYRKVQPAPA